MIKQAYHSNLPISPSDRVVAAVAFRDYVLVFTEQGDVWKVVDDD